MMVHFWYSLWGFVGIGMGLVCILYLVLWLFVCWVGMGHFWDSLYGLVGWLCDSESFHRYEIFLAFSLRNKSFLQVFLQKIKNASFLANFSIHYIILKVFLQVPASSCILYVIQNRQIKKRERISPPSYNLLY